MVSSIDVLIRSLPGFLVGDFLFGLAGAFSLGLGGGAGRFNGFGLATGVTSC